MATGMEMMLKSIGIDPEKIKQSVQILQDGVISLDNNIKTIANQQQQIINGLQSLHERLNTIEQYLEIERSNGHIPMISLQQGD